MGKNSDPTHGCYGKTRFRSFLVAWRAARALRKRLNERLRPYRCKHCRGFHFGHVSKQPARRSNYVMIALDE